MNVSYLSEELERQFARSRTNPLQLSEQIKISPSQIYKWLRSEQTSISAEQLTSLAKGLSSDENSHAALVLAHLQDERFGPGSNLVRIEILSDGKMSDGPKPRSKGEKALHYLAEQRVVSRDVNDLVIDLAKCLGADI